MNPDLTTAIPRGHRIDPAFASLIDRTRLSMFEDLESHERREAGGE